MNHSKYNLHGHIPSLLLKSKGRFANYQQIPPIVLRNLPELNDLQYHQHQVELDSKRYNWLTSQYKEKHFTAIEIGANIGFFSLSLAAERKASMIAFEPLSEYAVVCEEFCRIARLSHKIKVFDKPVTIGDLSPLLKVDLIICLNVLHHAGSEFDLEMVRSIQDWPGYAEQYLQQLSKISDYLFFQTGNMWNNKPLFPGEDTIPFTADLLQKSNWEIQSIGIIDDPSNLVYKTFSPDEIDKISKVTCRRNNQSGLVDYFMDGRIVANLRTGLAQRPLWFCSSREK